LSAGNDFDDITSFSILASVSHLPNIQKLGISITPPHYIQSFARQGCGIALPSRVLECVYWPPLMKFLHRCHPLCCMLLHAAAACNIFGSREANAHYMQPHAQLRLRPSQRARALSVHLWRAHDFGCERSIFRRRRLLRFSSMFAAVASRLSFMREYCTGSRYAACIMRRCLSMHGVNDLLRLLPDVDDDHHHHEDD
jgi:hypothetical protein